MRLNGKRSSEIQILQEISDMIHGTGSRPYPIPITEVAKMLGVTRGTVYNYIKRMKGLSKTNYNYGIIAEVGGWHTIDELKKSYGQIPPEKILEIIE